MEHTHMHPTLSLAPPARRPLAALAAVLLALGLIVASALPALAHAGEAEHSHGMGFEDADFLDPVIWDGIATVDCTAAGEGTIVWTLTGSDGIEYAELHIDEPVRTVTARTGGPYVWISPLYPLDEISADVDRIVGELADSSRVTAVLCPEGGSGDTGTLLAGVGGGIAVGAVLGLLVGRRRSSGV
jgi:hypothetical protein